ncbi:zinc finger protein 84-like [Contarinia nasturtii]|uniref:zinc finger protein 84-like n=1 Tax=Contarinia nasturtii TaxID=265458 RepID=UPI0012D48789|nr:zinc finger protein 84-like [Contarinia nasturtii]
MEANNDIPMIAVEMNQRVNSQKKRTSTVTSKNGANIKTKNGNLVAKEGPGEYYSEKMGSIAHVLKNNTTRQSLSSNQNKMKKRFKCQLCEYASNYKHALNRHMLTHTGEKPYQCDICQKGFIQANYMKKHKVTHKNEIPFHCRGCFTGFSQKVDQKTHEKVCKTRRYECHICKKFFTVGKFSLKEHMRKHNGEKPYRCEICMKRFTNKSNLKRHLENIHI